MGRRVEIPRDRFMARLATFRSGKLGPGNARWRDKRASRRGRAGNQNHGERRTRPYCPPEFFALAVQPSS